MTSINELLANHIWLAILVGIVIVIWFIIGIVALFYDYLTVGMRLWVLVAMLLVLIVIFVKK